VAKSPAQLDAEIAEALQGKTTNCDSDTLNALIKRIENAIDAHPELTRERPGKRGSEEAELIFSRGDWTARCKCRSKRAKGPGARIMHDMRAYGATPEEAVEDLIEHIPITAEVLR
jgi:hypothetical protein